MIVFLHFTHSPSARWTLTITMDRRAVKHLPVVGRGGCWLRYVGQSFGGVVSELVGERDGWSRPRLFRQILTCQI